MVEQRSPMVAWLRKMVKRGSIDSGDDAPANQQPERPIDDHSGSSISGSSEQNSEMVRDERTSTTSTPMITVDRGSTPALRQRLNLQDSASVMTIASSSKRRRQSIDTNASTRAMAAESVFSWSAEKERDREAGTPAPGTPGTGTPAPDRGPSVPYERSLSERVVSINSERSERS